MMGLEFLGSMDVESSFSCVVMETLGAHSKIKLDTLRLSNFSLFARAWTCWIIVSVTGNSLQQRQEMRFPGCAPWVLPLGVSVMHGELRATSVLLGCGSSCTSQYAPMKVLQCMSKFKTSPVMMALGLVVSEMS
jgi:hypothetical protein